LCFVPAAAQETAAADAHVAEAAVRAEPKNRLKVSCPVVEDLRVAEAVAKVPYPVVEDLPVVEAAADSGPVAPDER
jgi:hypothetical protein